MSTAAMTNRLELDSVAAGALKAAAGFWFLVAVIGQWAFLYYTDLLSLLPLRGCCARSRLGSGLTANRINLPYASELYPAFNISPRFSSTSALLITGRSLVRSQLGPFITRSPLPIARSFPGCSSSALSLRVE